MNYSVEGLQFATEPLAAVVAKRLFARYNKTRTISIEYKDTETGEVTTVRRWDAEKRETAVDRDTFDMFDDKIPMLTVRA